MDEADARTVATTIGALFHVVHDGMRQQVRDVDTGTLNWKPLPLANSIAVLISHALGAEREMIRAVRLLTTERDRDAEFKAEANADELLALIDRAGRWTSTSLRLPRRTSPSFGRAGIGLRSRAWSG
jgi:hypothetical protein